jgi:O-antigen ligase
LFPLAFAGNWQLEEKQWMKVTYLLLLLVAAGCCWSLWQYFGDMNAINESYLKAKTIPTPLKDDHVRFSWLVSIAILGGMLLIVIVQERKRKWLLSLLLLFLVAYLHVLSARTGLVLLYFFLACFVLFLAIQRKGKPLALIALLVMVCLLGWLLFPTLQNRIRYNRYDQSYIRNETYLPGASDGNRVLSLRAAWHTLQQNPFGVGAGDVRKATNEWYATNVPGMLESDKLYPSSEWMVYANMAGWPGFILFTAIMILPLCMKKVRHRFYWMMLNSMAAIGFLADTSLEVQYGVYIYSFFVLCWWKWFNSQKEITLKHD